MARQTREHKDEKTIVRTLVFPTVLYGCEMWAMTKKMEKKINACEMWIWRKMQRILWTEKKTNESVRMEILIEDETLQQTALRRKLGFFVHVMRSDGLEERMMLALGDGSRRRGRPRRKWMGEIQEVTGMKLTELRGVTTERKQWKKTVARTRRVDSTR